MLPVTFIRCFLQKVSYFHHNRFLQEEETKNEAMNLTKKRLGPPSRSKLKKGTQEGTPLFSPAAQNLMACRAMYHPFSLMEIFVQFDGEYRSFP